MGIIYAIIAGIAMSVQGVFNTNVSDNLGTWHTNVLVQAIALTCSVMALFFTKDGSFSGLRDVNKLYLLGGVLGAAITFTVMKSIDGLGTTFAIAIILVAQISAAAIIDVFGLFGSEKITFAFPQICGLLLMISGIILFKWSF